MPASTLSWKALPTIKVETLSDVGYIAALKTLFDSAKYADGSTRTGTSTAWTTTTLGDGSLRCTAPSNPLGLIAHFVPASLGASLPKSFGEATASATTGKVYGTIVLNPGTYASNTATPWGASARCFGYCHMAPMWTATPSNNPSSTVINGANINGFTSMEVRAWETKDAIVIHVWPNTGYGVIYVLGGWLAPDSSASDAENAESDGVLYGIMTSGNGSFIPHNYPNFYNWSHDTLNYGGYSTVASFMCNVVDTSLTSAQIAIHPHCGVFSPGSSSVIQVNRMGAFRVGATTSFVTPSQKLIKIPILFSSSTNFMGRAREMFMFEKSINGLVLRSGGSGGTDQGYIVSLSNSGTTMASPGSGDAFVLAI